MHQTRLCGTWNCIPSNSAPELNKIAATKSFAQHSIIGGRPEERILLERKWYDIGNRRTIEPFSSICPWDSMGMKMFRFSILDYDYSFFRSFVWFYHTHCLWFFKGFFKRMQKLEIFVKRYVHRIITEVEDQINADVQWRTIYIFLLLSSLYSLFVFSWMESFY